MLHGELMLHLQYMEAMVVPVAAVAEGALLHMAVMMVLMGRVLPAM